MKAHELSWVLVTMLGACTPSTELASLGHPELDVAAYFGSSYGSQVIVTVGYDGFSPDDQADCAALAVDATFDGSAFGEIEQGGWHEAGWNDPPDAVSHCVQPQLTMLAPPSGPAAIHIADASAAFDLVLPDLVAQRSLSLPSTPGFALHDGSAVALVPSMPATDTPAGFSAYGRSPDVDAVQPNGDYCGELVFQADAPASAGYELPVALNPSLIADPSCTPFLSSSLTTDVQIIASANPAIATCSGGARCTAIVTAETDGTALFVP